MEAVSRVAVSSHMNARCRRTMEDAHRVVDAFDGVPTQGYFAVYDGHGGRGIVEFIEHQLEKNVASELKFDEGNRTEEECLTSAFLITDIESKRAGLKVSGSTAVVCLVREVPDAAGGAPIRRAFLANAGDSRAVVARRSGSGGLTAERLTVDHKPSEEGEAKRIQDAGGFVLRGRVLGMLAVTRSFGDHGLKKFVPARPYTNSFDIVSSDETPFIILACDGLWDVMTDEEAVAFVAAWTGAGPDARADVAEALLHAALERGTTDNVTVMVVYL